MKLYATVSSERASKGQGGNKYLEIEVKNEEAQRIALMHFWPSSDGVAHRMTFQEGLSVDIDYQRFETKGNKKKDEVCRYHGVLNCSRCNPHHK